MRNIWSSENDREPVYALIANVDLVVIRKYLNEMGNNDVTRIITGQD